MPLTELPNRHPPDLLANGRNWEWLHNAKLDKTDLDLTGLTGDVTVSAAGVTAIGTGKVTSGMILDGTIGNADVNASAAIAASKLDPLLVQSTVENLKVLRGRIDTTGSGSILQGSGFTISRTGVGDLTINFTAAFSAIPSVTATAEDGTNSSVIVSFKSVAAGSVRCIRLQPAVSVLDGIFHFQAVGPR